MSESFNGRMRDELLDEALFMSMTHAWIEVYNRKRSLSSLDYETPAAVAAKLDKQWHGSNPSWGKRGAHHCG
ncbi:hypothetical protein EH31_12000 [Erythrobacter longus]|uniref:Integrase catalytic domain-containing protein n=1 Tax=Erythrobacter longus TaxID=1044 RepID=A0A074M8X2_ERYLO|nr:hypothetical protein EH31_12000 [Erythrobacter longus]